MNLHLFLFLNLLTPFFWSLIECLPQIQHKRVFSPVSNWHILIMTRCLLHAQTTIYSWHAIWKGHRVTFQFPLTANVCVSSTSSGAAECFACDNQLSNQLPMDRWMWCCKWQQALHDYPKFLCHCMYGLSIFLWHKPQCLCHIVAWG